MAAPRAPKEGVDVVRRALVIAALSAVAILATFVLVLPAGAHNWDFCGNGNTTKFYRSYTYETWPSTWQSEWQTALENARIEFNAAHFTYYKGAGLNWANLNSSDTTLAGDMAIRSWACGGTNLIYDASLYINVPHFQASPHTIGQRQCTVIHEMGHVVGLEHNDITSIENIPHSHRCHYWEIKKLQPHDISDINFRY
jgi:hypothetical protein